MGLKWLFFGQMHWEGIARFSGWISDRQELVLGSFVADGAFAKVFLGEYTMWFGAERRVVPVAVKRVKAAKTPPRELEFLLDLRDEPDVVYLHNYKTISPWSYFILEQCAGGDLQMFLRARRGPLSEPAARAVLLWLLRAARRCHERGIVHLDIKLENIGLLGGDLSALKLLDFGKAQRLGRAYPAIDLIGSPRYLAPELRDKCLCTTDAELKAIDVWCIGVVGFVLLSAQYPRGTAQLRRGSRAARAFIEGLLVDRAARPSIEACLAHEWFQGADGVVE